MSNHTKGKWEIKVWEYPGETKLVIQSKEHAVAEMLESFYSDHPPEYAREVAEANAERICQTHNNFDDLLAALKDVVKLTLDQTALDLDKQGQIDDLGTALTVCTAQFNSKAVKNALQLIAQIEKDPTKPPK